jgi:hypothetical protein
MEESKKSNIVIGLLVLIIIILVSAWAFVYAPINVTRNYSDSTYVCTRDGLKGIVCWSTKYKAPLIMPKEIKLETQDKIKLYTDITLKSFFLLRLSHPISDYGVNKIQSEFNEQDDMQRKFARIFHMEGFENLKNLKSIKIETVRFENHKEPDSLRNVMMTLRQDANLIKLQGDYGASQIRLQSMIKRDVIEHDFASNGSVSGIDWQIIDKTEN